MVPEYLGPSWEDIPTGIVGGYSPALPLASVSPPRVSRTEVDAAADPHMADFILSEWQGQTDQCQSPGPRGPDGPPVGFVLVSFTSEFTNFTSKFTNVLVSFTSKLIALFVIFFQVDNLT